MTEEERPPRLTPGRAQDQHGLEVDLRNEQGSYVNATPDPPALPTSEELERLALLTCQEHRFRLYLGDGTNTPRPGNVSAKEAVRSGGPFFGFTLPHVWGIDVDLDVTTPDGERVRRQLLALLDSAGLDEVIECWSGQPGHLHVFVYEPGDVDRKRIAEHFRADVDSRVDFRLQKGGSPIRPPGAPHRLDSHMRSTPDIGWREAIEMFEDWAERAGHVPRRSESPTAVTGSLNDLSERDQALRRSDWMTADKVGPPVPRHGDRVDRSAVDIALAAGFLSAGLTVEDFVQDRMPMGSCPSPRALDEADPEGYLRSQFDWALTHPLWSKTTVGLADLDEFEFLTVYRNLLDLDLTARTLLSAMCAKATSLGRTRFDWDRRDMNESTDLGMGPIATATGRLEKAGVVRRRPASRVGFADNYQLNVVSITERLNECKNRTHTVTSEQTLYELFLHLPPPFHPAYSRAGLKRTAWSVLLCFTIDEPRTVTEASKLGGPCLRTFRDRAKELRAIGALVSPDGGSSYIVDPEFNFDQYADDRGLWDRRLRRAHKHDEERRVFTRNAQTDQVDPLTAAESLERFARISTRQRQCIRPTQVVLGDGRSVNPHTGEIAVAEPELPINTAPQLCRACGRPTSTIGQDTGLPLHDGCLYPPWVARIERRHGVSIPDHLVKPLLSPDQGEFGEPESTNIANLRKDHDMTNDSFETEAVA